MTSTRTSKVSLWLEGVATIAASGKPIVRERSRTCEREVRVCGISKACAAVRLHFIPAPACLEYTCDMAPWPAATSRTWH